MLGVFKFPAAHKDYADFVEEIQGIIDEMHEYYYKPMIFEIFYVYEHRFIHYFMIVKKLIRIPVLRPQRNGQCPSADGHCPLCMKEGCLSKYA